jgi:hypothetical protein
MWVCGLAIAAVVVAGIFSFSLIGQHTDFSTNFGVKAPVNMSQDERDILQPLVTKQLKELSKQVFEIKSKVCADAECTAQKLADFQSSQKALDDAVDAARHFDFDTSIPLPLLSPTCADGREPANGLCGDGSTPTAK